MTNFQSYLDRIKAAKTSADLDALEARVTRAYDLGLLSARELGRLDVRIMESKAKL